MPVKLDHLIHACAFDLVVYLCAFPCRCLTLAPETAEETYVEISDTELEDPVGASSTTYPGKGETYITLYSLQPAMLSCGLERLHDPIHLTFASIKPQKSHDPH